MPVSVKQIGSKHRIVEAATGKIATTPSGKPRDGGGHSLHSKAQAQANAINAGIAKNKKKK